MSESQSSLDAPSGRGLVARPVRKSSFASESPSAASTVASDSDEALDATLLELTEDEAEAARELQAAVEADPQLLAAAKRNRGRESLRALCLRFVRARPQGHLQAFTMLKADLRYRDEHSVADLRRKTLEEVLAAGPAARGVPADIDLLMAEYWKQMPHGLLGFDRRGQAVMYRSLAGLRIWELEKLGGAVDDVLRQFQWLNERCLHSMGHRGRWVQIINMDGCGFAQCSSRLHFSFIRKLAELDSEHYPERLGQVFVINVAPFVTNAYKLVSTWLPEKTRQRVKLLGGEEEWRSAISECMDLRMLPLELGGNMVLSTRGAAPFDTIEGAGPGSGAAASTLASSLRRSAFEAASKEATSRAPLPPRRFSLVTLAVVVSVALLVTVLAANA